jgi:hypothetical protein
LFGLSALSRLSRQTRACAESLRQLESERELKIHLEMDDDTLKNFEIEGGTVTRVEQNGENTTIHVEWKI